jgi:hypothetical protein
VHTFGVAVEQRKPGSTVQVAEHPSDAVVFPSSQASGASRKPSPHITIRHIDGVPLQTKPVSTPQLLEQPSPPAVFPSSHVSPLPDWTLPLPQVRVHTPGDAVVQV